MDKKELIISGIIVVIALIVASMIFSPVNEAKATTIEVLNKGDVGENGTIYVMLTDYEKSSLSEKTVHIEITNSSGNVVYDESVKTHATGVAIVKLNNLDSGKYNLTVSFDGDENYTKTSISQEITIGDVDTEEVEDAALIEDTLNDAQQTSSSSAQTHSQSSSSSSSSRQSSSSDTDDDNGGYIDENGNEITVTYDENGKIVDST